MNYKMIGRFIWKILGVEAICMIPALLISIFNHESKAVLGFVVSLAIIGFVVLLLYFLCKKTDGRFRAREGMVCVGLSWIFMSILGCLPFYISREIPSLVDAIFETVSGFTTTGASILEDVEVMSKGLLYWRSFTHWIGGMGVLVFLLAIMSGDENKNGFTMHLLRAESPGPNVGKLVPKMKQTAMILYVLYIVITVVDIIFLLFGRMPLFEAVCTALGTAGTGGFGVKGDSIAGYSPYIQNVCTVFMFLFGVNFSCYYLIILGQIKSVLKDEELRLYAGIVIGSIILITINLGNYYSNLGETIRYAAFQVVSIVTTTGYATADFDLWPEFSKAIILCLMIVGASAGSTGGGFKCGRLLLVVKSMRRNVRQVLRPQRVQVVRLNNQPVDEKILENTNAYLAAYAIILGISYLLVSIDGYSITTNVSAVISCFNNIGPGFDMVGPTCNFSAYGIISKIVLIIDMLAGRLEIFPMIVLFSRSAWKK